MSTSNNFIVKNNSGGEFLELPAICDLIAAGKIHASITDRVAETDLAIKAGSVERCSTAVAQVLIAASDELRQQGSQLIFLSMSEQFKQSFFDLGLGDCVQEWERRAQ